MFPADEFGSGVNDLPAPVILIDDNIHEPQEELFVVALTLENAVDPGSVVITRSLSICRITDNDGGCPRLSQHISSIVTVCTVVGVCDVFVD